MRRSNVTSSSPFGVSITFITERNRGSRMIRRNGSGPSDPSPTSSWRSRREPNGVLESFKWRQRRRPNPIVFSHRRQTESYSRTRS
jgi:hypothetical protein